MREMRIKALLLAWAAPLLVGAATLLASAPARGAGLGDSLGLSPFWDWRTLETEHFRLTFPVELTETAQKSARYLEEANAALSQALYWQPPHRTQILVIDNADAANGLTTPLGRFGIVFLVTPPDNWFSTAYYDDWLRLLAFHEYTHLVNMDTTKGFIYETLRVLFGDTFLPNTTWPAWMLEGLAVYMETRFTRAGRGTSAFYDMVLRAAVEENTLDTDRFVTLDRLTGDTPYFPAGEMAYLFGYSLMNQVAREPNPGAGCDEAAQARKSSADQLNPVKDGEDVLGRMSESSGRRVPFFINSTLENLTCKSWYDYWNDWVARIRKHSGEQLARIKARPLTRVEKLTTEAFDTLGPAASPDGKYLAYTQGTSDRRSGLYLRELATGRTRRLVDKSAGVALAFTPDSRRLVYSALHRSGAYNLWSDLAVYDLERDRWDWLGDAQRAKDPDVSRDGKWVAYAQSADVTTGLGLAPLITENGRLRLGPPRRLYWPARYDRATTPKFSPDGRKIAFTLHRNGNPGEELVELDVASGQLTTLLANGKMNRFPAYDGAGALYFISDLSGVDNLYRYESPGHARAVTNVTTGLMLPAFGPGGAYASVFSSRGWDVARLELPAAAAPALETPAVSPAPGPVTDALSSSQSKPVEYPVEGYSVFPSLWPRQWAPILTLDSGGIYVGGVTYGFDATDRHEYVAGLAYDSQLGKADWVAVYANRMLGPTFTFFGLNQSQNVETDAGGGISSFGRKVEFSASAQYPIQWTYSSLVPSLALNAERTSVFVPGANGGEPVDQSEYVPNATAAISFTDAESSRLAISSESGRNTTLGSRVYVSSGARTFKGLFTDTEYLPVSEHTVLVPALKGSWVSRRSGTFTDSNVVAEGRTRTLVNSLPDDNFDQLAIRGYPNRLFIARAAAVASLDFRFPLLRIFRGWGTRPVFLDNLSGFTFAETTYFPAADASVKTLPSAGGGVRLTTDLLIHVPVIVSLEYHHGFRTERGGQGEAFLGVNLSPISF